MLTMVSVITYYIPVYLVDWLAKVSQAAGSTDWCRFFGCACYVVTISLMDQYFLPKRVIFLQPPITFKLAEWSDADWLL